MDLQIILTKRKIMNKKLLLILGIAIALIVAVVIILDANLKLLTEVMLGAVIFNFLLFRLAKNKSDAKGEKFDYDKYANSEWDDWAWVVLSSFILSIHNGAYMIQSVAAINFILSKTGLNWELPVLDLFYLMGGVFAHLLSFGIQWVMSFINGKKAHLIPEQ